MNKANPQKDLNQNPRPQTLRIFMLRNKQKRTTMKDIALELYEKVMKRKTQTHMLPESEILEANNHTYSSRFRDSYSSTPHSFYQIEKRS